MPFVEINVKKEIEKQREINPEFRKAWNDSREEYKRIARNWVPVDTGLYPNDMEAVQVTYIGYNDHEPHCDAFAYRNEDKWFWSLDDMEVKVEITAWKSNCEAYREN